MKRRDFFKLLGGGALATAIGSSAHSVSMDLNDLKAWSDEQSNDKPMPVLFVGHGNPMNAIEDNQFSRTWKSMGKSLPTPKAILCVSAHWLSNKTKVAISANPVTIHDFGGFPQALFDVQYPAPGAPELAIETAAMIHQAGVEHDEKYGLDHGAWSVIMPMFPEAKIPVFQLSIDYTKPPQWHFNLAKELAELRKKGVLIIGSGNIVHSFAGMVWDENAAHPWAMEFDEKISKAIQSKDDATLINYLKIGKSAELSVPTNDHYLPLLYAAGLRNDKDGVQFFNQKVSMGSMSMTSVVFG